MTNGETDHDEGLDQALAAAHRLLELDGVEGIGEGATDDGVPCVLLLVTQLGEAARNELPEEIHGYPVRLHELGSPPMAQPGSTPD